MPAARFDGIPRFEEAIAAARARGVVLPDTFYRELPRQVRARAFTVSGLARLDQIQRVLDSLGDALDNKTGFAEWKRQALADPALARMPRGRLDTIYRNATQQNYLAGHWQKHQRVKDARPFLIYDAINDSRTRPTHKAMDNYIAPVDDPVWNRWYPPNGHRCRCGVRSLTQAQAEARGWQGSPRPTPAEPDAGWSYNPATTQDNALRKLVDARIRRCAENRFAKKRAPGSDFCSEGAINHLESMATAIDGAGPLPDARSMNIPLVEKGLSEKEYLSRFMRHFDADANESVIVKDPTGEIDLLLSALIFTNHGTGKSKIGKAGRERYLNYIAQAVRDPDEMRLKRGGHGDLTMQIIARYMMGGDTFAILSTFKNEGKVWTGWSAYQTFNSEYLERKRSESIAIYRRGE